MILNLLSTAYFHITILNRTAWFDIYKNISLIFIIFQGIFIRSRNRIKQDFCSSLDICEHVSPVQVILITWVKYKIAKWILINFEHTVSKTFSNTSTFDTRHSYHHFAHNLFVRFYARLQTGRIMVW